MLAGLAAQSVSLDRALTIRSPVPGRHTAVRRGTRCPRAGTELGVAASRLEGQGGSVQEVTFTRAGRGVGSGLARQREGRVLQIETPSKCQGPEAEERSSGKDRVGGGARGTRCAWTSRRGPGVRVHQRPAGVTTSRGVGTGAGWGHPPWASQLQAAPGCSGQSCPPAPSASLWLPSQLRLNVCW